MAEQPDGPEAVLIDHVLERDPDTASLKRQPLDNPSWHLVDAMRALTWCGLDIGYGARRRMWGETPREQRCVLCIGRMAAAPADG